jgi:hypothetical protein
MALEMYCEEPPLVPSSHLKALPPLKFCSDYHTTVKAVCALIFSYLGSYCWDGNWRHQGRYVDKTRDGGKDEYV